MNYIKNNNIVENVEQDDLIIFYSRRNGLNRAITPKNLGKSFTSIKGDKGDKGDNGESGNGFTYQITIASSVWTVPHNLNKYPNVSIVDTSGNVIYADIAYINLNVLQVTHGMPITGAVYCN